MSAEPIRLAVLGAGPAGLMLTLILLRNSPPTSNFTLTIFERDSAPDSPLHRPQGGSLDLHADSGQAAMRAAGLWEQFLQHARYEGQETTILDKHATVLAQRGEEADKPEIGRGELRGVLAKGLAGLKDKRVRLAWRSHVLGLKHADSGVTIEVEGDKQEGPFDVVVAADGTGTTARALLTPLKPLYSGMTVIESRLPTATASAHPSLSELVGQGGALAFGSGRALMAQRNPEDIRIYAALRVPEDWMHKCGIDWTDPRAAKAALLSEYYADWAPQLRALLETCVDEVRLWPLYGMPTRKNGGGWAHKRGLALVGDAAHVMPIWTGRGVNMALLDALELGKGLAEALAGERPRAEQVDRADRVLASYEEAMFERMNGEAEAVAQAQEMLFAEDSPATLAAMIKAAQEGKE